MYKVSGKSIKVNSCRKRVEISTKWGVFRFFLFISKTIQMKKTCRNLIYLSDYFLE